MKSSNNSNNIYFVQIPYRNVQMCITLSTCRHIHLMVKTCHSHSFEKILENVLSRCALDGIQSIAMLKVCLFLIMGLINELCCQTFLCFFVNCVL